MTFDAHKARERLDGLLGQFVNGVDGVDSAMLATLDGLALAHYGLTGDDADRQSAVLSGLFILARGTGERRGDSTGFRQIVIDLGDKAGTLFVMVAGTSALLTAPSALGVWAAPKADAGLIGFEMSRLIGRLADHPTTTVRHSEGASGGDL